MSRPLAIDIFCGLGGWTEGFLAEGWDVIGFDIERHQYGQHRYPAQLVLQDARTISGAQFAPEIRRRPSFMFVASSPCQEFSYRAMPWKRAKALGPPMLGMELFAQAERIRREASVAVGWTVPLIQENVRGAQKYVGRAQWNYASYFLWGDIPLLMPFKGNEKKSVLGSITNKTEMQLTSSKSAKRKAQPLPRFRFPWPVTSPTSTTPTGTRNDRFPRLPPAAGAERNENPLIADATQSVGRLQRAFALRADSLGEPRRNEPHGQRR